MTVTITSREFEVEYDHDFVAETRVDDETYAEKFRKLIAKMRIGQTARVRQNGQVAIWKRVDARRNEGSALKQIFAVCF